MGNKPTLPDLTTFHVLLIGCSLKAGSDDQMRSRSSTDDIKPGLNNLEGVIKDL